MAELELRVINATTVPQVFQGYLLPVGQWVTVPLSVAFPLAREGVCFVHPVDLANTARWKFNGKYHVLWLSPFSCGDGYATAAEAIVWGLLQEPKLALDVKSCWFTVERGLRPETIAAARKVAEAPSMVGICMATPGEFRNLPTPYRIGWTMYETSNPLERYPQWRKECTEVDELWVPTTAIIEIFSKFVPSSKLHVMPLALNPVYREGRVGLRPARADDFHIVMWGGLTDRKSPLEVLRTFKHVFPLARYPNVRMTFKTRCGLFGRDTYQLPERDELDPRVRVVDDTWLPERMIELGQDADLFVFPSKGEGFGLPPREAILLGVPTIISNTSGMREIANPKYVWVVPIEKRAKCPLGGTWDLPDWKTFADMLMWHYHHREEARAKAAKAAEWLWETRSPSAVAKLIMGHLLGLDPEDTIRARPLKLPLPPVHREVLEAPGIRGVGITVR